MNRDQSSRFPVNLVRHDGGSAANPDVKAIVAQCPPHSLRLYPSGTLVATLVFSHWPDARAAVLCLWRSRLAGHHSLSPHPTRSRPDLDPAIRDVFADRVRALIDGGGGGESRAQLCAEIERVSALLRKPVGIHSFNELSDTKSGLCDRLQLLDKRVAEFESALRCVLAHLQGEESSDGALDPITFASRRFNWNLVHSLLLRECRRLADALPIYAHRSQILHHIHSHQVTVLIGETGSGKSTQLVQFLADSGVAASDAIVCTQPRKIAASSLAHRVNNEASGCYSDYSITCYPSFSSALCFDSKVIYTTDHCLLQYYMSDNNMSGISCLIVDEAHERSLNTDLLLALIRTLLCRRSDLRLVIMSATIEAKQFSDYFFGCRVLHVVGRNFPVEIQYAPCAVNNDTHVAAYVSEVVRMASDIHKKEEEGAILAFLTSPSEVDWACDKFVSPSAVALPLHGKLSSEEQYHAFRKYPGKRKVIFATNLAETSLTIPGVKYVIDSGMVKESKYDPGSGINVLRVCRISKSSANQRAGRAGRTGPGRCYRLYSEFDFEAMPLSQEPEIRRVHLGVAVLRIFGLGVKNVQEFDFIDAPSADAIDMAVRNLVQLRAVRQKNGVYELTDEGRWLVKVGIEPRLGKLILGCFNHQLGREGIVLAAVMANASSIFFRVGTDEEKLKSDCLKVKFCHQHGDLFTLLSVYKEWEAQPRDGKSKWCLENSINAKTMRRCHETVLELEGCLERELTAIIPSYWRWNPDRSTAIDKSLKKVILFSLAENVAMYSGNDKLGYEVAVSGQHVLLHPSCSLLVYSQKPSWVVFSDLLSTTQQYLVCVTCFDLDCLSTMYPPPLFDASTMESRKLQLNVLTGFGSTVLKRFCGKSSSKLHCVVSRIRELCEDDRSDVKVDVEQNEITLFAGSRDMERVTEFVKDSVECEQRWMHNECLEKRLYQGLGIPSIALFGAGAEIKHLELEKRCLTVDVYCSNASSIDPIQEKELLIFIEKFCSGSICAFQKLTPTGQETDDIQKFGRITFLSPGAAQKATELNQTEYTGTKLKVIPSQPSFGGGDPKVSPFPAVNAKVKWPRRFSRGFARENQPDGDCGEALFKAISQFMPKTSSQHTSCYRVQVFPSEPKDAFTRAMITFDGRLHLEAAKALEQIDGQVLPGCQLWQKIKCQHSFQSSLTCSGPVYFVIKNQLDSLIRHFTKKGVECNLEPNVNGNYRVRITANATRTIADVRRRMDELVRGKAIEDKSLTPTVLQLLFSRDGINLMHTVQRETGTHIFFNRHNISVRVFGCPEKIAAAQQKLVDSLLALHESKQLEIHLRGKSVPPNLMKQVVSTFGADLHGLKEKVPGGDFTLNARRHVILMQGDKELKSQVEEIIYEVGRTEAACGDGSLDNHVTCPICLCDFEDAYQLEGCTHNFCRFCLLEQCDSAIRNQDSFPILCAHKDCGSPILVSDLKSLLSAEKLEELFRASLGSFVARSGGAYKFCPSPDCPAVYRVGDTEEAFVCGACCAETCRKCHLESHMFVRCDKYREYKEDPDLSLKEWSAARQNVKKCPVCKYVIEKLDGCNHLECHCKKHICWVCLQFFETSELCYTHLRAVHSDID